MEIETFNYTRAHGWSVPRFPDLDSDRTLVMLFGAPEFMDDQEALDTLSRAYPRARFIGCSTAGEIFGSTLMDQSISVAVTRFEDTQLRTSNAAIHPGGESFEAGAHIARELNDPSLKGILVLSDGTSVNGSKLVEGLNSVLGGRAVVTGGLAGDGSRFKRTWVIQDRTPRCGQISAVGFYGDKIRIGHGSKGGWDLFGPERKVTNARDNVLYELDGKPALKLYKEYLGDLASGLPATALLFPLALRSDSADPKAIVRTILSVDEGSQSMVFAGDIPQNSLAQFMRANFDRLVEGAFEAGSLCGRNTKGGPSQGPWLSVAISCVGRRLVLGERVEEELEATLDALPKACRQVGFYSYGEISPYNCGSCDLHNQTMTLTTLGEGP